MINSAIIERGIIKLSLAAGIFLLAGFLAGVCRAADEKAQEEARLITLPQGIAMVLKDSRLVKISLFDKDMSFEDSLFARSALLPQLNTQVTWTHLKNQPAALLGSQNVDTAQRESLSYGFDVYQTLFDFGKSLNIYRASKETLSASLASTESIKRVAVLEFVIGYFDLLEAERMILVAEKELESLTSYLRDIEHLYEQGSAIKNDLLPAKVKLADAKQKLVVSRNRRAVGSSRLNNMLALPLREKIRLQDIEMQPPQVPEMEEAWNTAQLQRPEIVLLGDQIKASALSERAKAVENFPALFADGGYTFAENKYQAHEENVFINLGAKAKLYDGGAARAELLKERYKQRQLTQRRGKLVEDIKFEVEDSYLGLKNAGENVLVAKDALDQARENVRVRRIEYAEGAATATDVLEAIALETSANTNYYNADYDLKRNYAKLMYSMGIDLALVYDRMNKKDTNGTERH